MQLNYQFTVSWFLVECKVCVHFRAFFCTAAGESCILPRACSLSPSATSGYYQEIDQIMSALAVGRFAEREMIARRGSLRDTPTLPCNYPNWLQLLRTAQQIVATLVQSKQFKFSAKTALAREEKCQGETSTKRL